MSDNDAGFTLTEVLVSFVIIAGALTVLLPIVGDNLRLGSAAQQTKAATELAQSKLAQIGTVMPLRQGRQEGVENGFRWQVQIGSPARINSPDAGRLALFDVVSAVGRDETSAAPLVTLRTQRLGMAP